MFKYNMLPCHKENKDNIYYKGNTTIFQNNERCRKCEFVKSLCYFMFKEYKEYALEKCCDVDHPNTNQPEAILVNKKNPLDKIVIEVKSLHHLFDRNIKRNEKERGKTYCFRRSLDKIGEKVFEIVDAKLDEMNISLTPELTKLFLYGLVLNVYVDSEYRESNGVKYIESKSTYKEFTKYRYKNEISLINNIASNVVDYIIGNIISCMNSYKFIPFYEFKIDKFNFTIGKTNKESWFSIHCFEGSGENSFLRPPKDTVEIQMKDKFFEECKEKFADYMDNEYKRILLIINENKYIKYKLVERMKKIEKPQFIDEIWCAFYEYEDIWNEKLEDFDDEEIVDINYFKL